MNYYNDQNIESFYYGLVFSGLLNALKNYANGCGDYSRPYESCKFPEDWEEWEDDFYGGNGICYSFLPPAVDEPKSVIVDYDTFYEHLTTACQEYINNNPHEKDILDGYLKKVQGHLEHYKKEYPFYNVIKRYVLEDVGE